MGKNRDEKEKLKQQKPTLATETAVTEKSEESQEMESEVSEGETSDKENEEDTVSAEERKLKRKELQKKRKSELRRKKRELHAETEKALKVRQEGNLSLLEHDLQKKIASDKISGVKKKMKKEKNVLDLNGTVESSKVNDVSSSVETDGSSKKKKKKKKIEVKI